MVLRWPKHSNWKFRIYMPSRVGCISAWCKGAKDRYVILPKDLLFSLSVSTCRDLVLRGKQMHGDIGQTAVLHTWPAVSRYSLKSAGGICRTASAIPNGTSIRSSHSLCPLEDNAFLFTLEALSCDAAHRNETSVLRRTARRTRCC